ncbi:hypothetical protein D3C71_1422570 [compost metagenome]
MHFALGNVAEQLFEAGVAGREIPGIQLHPCLENAQLDARLYLFDAQGLRVHGGEEPRS